MESKYNLDSGLTDEEEHIMTHLVEAWNSLLLLTEHPDELVAFREGIHVCQSVLAKRALWRVLPRYWNEQ